MDCSPAGSSVQGIFQARKLEWVVISSSRGSSPPRDQTCSLVHCRWSPVLQADFYHLSHQGSPSLLYLDGKIMLAVFFPATRSWCPRFIFDHAFICYLDLILCLLKILGSPHTVSFTFCFESSDTEESDRDPRDSRAGTQSLCLRSYCFPGPEILSGNRKETPSQNIQMHKPEREIYLNSRSEQGK